MKKRQAQIIDIAEFLPPQIITPDGSKALDPLEQNEWFRAPKQRRFASPQISSSQMGVEAVKALLKKTKLKPEKIDLILCTCVFRDEITASIAPDVQYKVGAKNATVFEVDAGCASFLSMLTTARAYIESGIYENIIILTVTNFVSRLSDFQKSPKASVLGDGAAATLVSPGKQSIIAHYERAHGENYGLLSCRPTRKKGEKALPFWDEKAGPLAVEFSFRMVEKLRTNAIELVSAAALQALKKAKLSTKDIALFITHQPNLALINTWREKVGFKPPHVFDTFQQYGNLFHASIPVTLAEAAKKKKLKDGDLVLLATFSNGGDFVSAMVIRWFAPAKNVMPESKKSD